MATEVQLKVLFGKKSHDRPDFNPLTPERAFWRASKQGVHFVPKKAPKGSIFCQMTLYDSYMKLFIVLFHFNRFYAILD